jgi:hypothetical protein
MDANKTIEERLTDLENRVKKIEGNYLAQSTVIPGVKKKSLSAKEFLITKTIQTEIQKTLVLAYYLEYIEGMNSFNVSDLENAFRSAKEKLPKNLNDAVNKNIARGLLMEAKEKKETKKAWVLTSTGENYVEQDLNKDE